MIARTDLLALVAALAATAAYIVHPDPTTRDVIGGAWVAFLALLRPGFGSSPAPPAQLDQPAGDLRDAADRTA